MVNRYSILLYLYYSVWVNICKNCRPFMPSQFIFMRMLHSGMLYDFNTLPTSKLKLLSSAAILCICFFLLLELLMSAYLGLYL